MAPAMKPHDDTTVKDLISICSKLIEVFTASVAQNAEMLKVMRDQNDILRKSNERMEAFLFMGDPAKSLPSFVTETRDGIEDNSWSIKRMQETISSAQGAISRAIWIAVTVVITAGVGAFLVWRFPPVP
jgi:hypothetical protein